MRRREFIGLLGGAVVAWPLAAPAQQAGRMRRIGFLYVGASTTADAQARIGAFRGGLASLGWTTGGNLRIEERYGTGADELRAHAAELLALAPDIILAGSASAVAPLQQATRTIPIVFANVPDPVVAGFVTSIARPGGNITGFANYEQTFAVKWIELLKQIAPRVVRTAFIYDPANPATLGYLQAIEGASASLGIKVQPAPVHGAADIEQAVTAFARDPNGGMIVPGSPTTTTHRDLIIALAARHRLPAVSPFREDARDGFLASHGIDVYDLFRSSASYVDRILKGEKPGELPVQFATKFELVINLKTAKALGLDPPITLLARTDAVIE
jgi:putative tryptophan/tyrosine transport system substrate-binding protein